MTGPGRSFPTNRQVGATLVAAVLVVTGAAVYLFRPQGTPGPAPSVPAVAVGVVRNGPALLAEQPLGGGRATRTVRLPGTPSTMVTTPDGRFAYVLDTAHADVIPVDLRRGVAARPIPAGKLPVTEKLSADGSTLDVADNLGSALIQIDTATGTLRPVRPLSQGVDGYTPSPVDASGVETLSAGEGQPGILAFVSPAGGPGNPFEVGANGIESALYQPDGGTVWALEGALGGGSGAVYPVDVRTQHAGAAVAVGRAPTDMAMSADGRYLVVISGVDGTAAVVDTGTRRLVGFLPVCAGPSGVAVTGDTAWVACSLTHEAVTVDLTTRQRGEAVLLPQPATAVAEPRAGGAPWVLYGSTPGSVSFLSSRGQPGRSVAVGNDPHLVISRDSLTEWVANTLSDSVQRIDRRSATAGKPIRVDSAPSDLALTQGDAMLAVLSFGDGEHAGHLTAVDTRSGATRVPIAVGRAPSSLTVAPDGSAAYVANRQDDAISTVDLRRWQAGPVISLPCAPDQLVVAPDGSTLFANCVDDGAVVPVSLPAGLVGTPIGVQPDATLTVGNQSKTLFVNGSHYLTEIDIPSRRLVIGKEETSNIIELVPSPDDSTLVALENTGADVLVINAATLVTESSVAVGGRPDFLVVTPDGTRAYVMDTIAQKVTVVDVAAHRVVSRVAVGPNAGAVVAPSNQ